MPKLLIAALVLALQLSAPARADESSKQLFKAASERWFKIIEAPSTPEFIKSRADQMAAENGADESIDYLAMLKADERGFDGKYSSLIAAGGPYYGLTRQLKPKYAMAFLQTGKMEPRAGNFGNNSESDAQPGVYFELNLKNYMKTFKWADAELMFDAGILDERTDYIVNPSWSYGIFDMYSAAPAVNPGRVAYYIRYLLTQQIEWQGKKTYRDNEVVFVNAVGIEYLKSITLPAGMRDEFIRDLRSHKVPLPKHWKDWESHILGKAKPKAAANSKDLPCAAALDS